MRTGDTAKELLDAELDARTLSVRGLARLMAAHGGDAEKHRRAVNRIVNEDKTPKEDTAAAIEAALGKPTGWLPRFDPKRPRAADGLTLAGLASAHERLVETVARLDDAVGALERRLAALESRPARRGSRPA